MAHYTSDQIRTLISGFRAPDGVHYPELAEYTRDELYEDFFGGGRVLFDPAYNEFIPREKGPKHELT